MNKRKSDAAVASCVIPSILLIFLVFPLQSVRAAETILLDCEREDGYGPVQIYIDVAKMYILYNAQVRSNNYERYREYSVVNGAPGETMLQDDGIDINANTDRFIQASDQNSTFIFVKGDATFAYAWTTLIRLEESDFMAFGNSHTGKCSVNPFNLLVQ